MAFRDLSIKDNYSSDDSNILEELFRPCLSNSVLYYRSVGYLDSKILALLGEEFERLAETGGSARLLIGMTTSPDDYIAIKKGRNNPERFLSIPSLEALWADTSQDQIRRRGLLVLSWMVAHRTLHIRFSIRPRGIHHDKFALFRDEDGQEVIVHGTNNETTAASLPEFNYESLSVFKSWESEIYSRHGEYKLHEFLRLWEGHCTGSISVDAPNEVLEPFLELYEQERSKSYQQELFKKLESIQEHYANLPQVPIFWQEKRYFLREHQKEAINTFFSGNYRGILAHATGSGKTLSALHACTVLARSLACDNEVDVLLIVAVPYQVLADQWVENMERFSYTVVRAYGSVAQWKDKLERVVNRALMDPGPRVTAVVAVNKTLQSSLFRNIIEQISDDRIIFVGDECHRLASAIEAGKLPDAEYRMGLSATPWTSSEQDLRKHLESYFGRVVSAYRLEDAFRDGVLVPYEYWITEVHLSAEEAERYTDHTAELKRLTAIKMSGGEVREDSLNFHRYQRAAVLGSANEKFEQLSDVLRNVEARMGLNHLLVYCGSGSTDDDGSGEDSGKRDIERAQQVASRYVDLQSARITASESQAVRQSILGAFDSGSLDAVFAIKVLDEGFDMPGIRSAVLLASSRNERQFVQRRGRVLRTAVGKDSAVLWDFLISGIGTLSPEYARELAWLELCRGVEFARLATNWGERERQLREYAERHDVNYDEIVSAVETANEEVYGDG